MSAKFLKLKLQLRGYLTGAAQFDKSYLCTLNALNLAEKWHTGTRKDKVTPEFQHQIEITQFLRTLVPQLMYPANTLSAALLHDTGEDYSLYVSMEDILNATNSEVVNAVKLLTKKNHMFVKDVNQYFHEMSLCPISSVVKGVDRIHNLQTMVGVFSPAKQLSYIEEVETYFLPMLKKAKRNFPQQEAVYEMIKFVLVNYVNLIKAMHSANNPEV